MISTCISADHLNMERRIAILQPGYLPWLGYFDQMHSVDLFIHYDDVQYTRNDWRNRNRIKGPNGPQWLTIPVAIRHRFGSLINEVEVTDSRWQVRHLKTIQQCYSKCPHFDSLFPQLEAILAQPWTRLVDGCLECIGLIRDALDIRTPTMLSSNIGYAELSKTDRLLAMCQKLGATTYLSGAAARCYLDVAAFTAAGIDVMFQDYQHPTYTQRYGDFISHLSVIDLLMNEGPRARDILASDAITSIARTG